MQIANLSTIPSHTISNQIQSPDTENDLFVKKNPIELPKSTIECHAIDPEAEKRVNSLSRFMIGIRDDYLAEEMPPDEPLSSRLEAGTKAVGKAFDREIAASENIDSEGFKFASKSGLKFAKQVTTLTPGPFIVGADILEYTIKGYRLAIDKAFSFNNDAQNTLKSIQEDNAVTQETFAKLKDIVTNPKKYGDELISHVNQDKSNIGDVLGFMSGIGINVYGISKTLTSPSTYVKAYKGIENINFDPQRLIKTGAKLAEDIKKNIKSPLEASAKIINKSKEKLGNTSEMASKVLEDFRANLPEKAAEGIKHTDVINTTANQGQVDDKK